jgi:hypothetical protein
MRIRIWIPNTTLTQWNRDPRWIRIPKIATNWEEIADLFLPYLWAVWPARWPFSSCPPPAPSLCPSPMSPAKRRYFLYPDRQWLGSNGLYRIPLFIFSYVSRILTLRQFKLNWPFLKRFLRNEGRPLLWQIGNWHMIFNAWYLPKQLSANHILPFTYIKRIQVVKI